MKQGKYTVLLHILLVIYALSSVAGKLAAGEPFFSPRFCLCYGMMIALLGIYAVGWQQVIKHMDLTSAYAAKAATVIWGFVFGVLLFKEQVTAGKLAGLALITAGIVLFGIDDGENAV